jgi:hypothetical protein
MHADPWQPMSERLARRIVRSMPVGPLTTGDETFLRWLEAYLVVKGAPPATIRMALEAARIPAGPETSLQAH